MRLLPGARSELGFESRFTALSVYYHSPLWLLLHAQEGGPET